MKLGMIIIMIFILVILNYIHIDNQGRRRHHGLLGLTLTFSF